MKSKDNAEAPQRSAKRLSSFENEKEKRIRASRIDLADMGRSSSFGYHLRIKLRPYSWSRDRMRNVKS
jgi:hypothetical protein